MKIATQTKAAHINNTFAAPLRPAPMQRAHSHGLDSFHRQSQGRPQFRRAHSAPRVALAHARPAPDAKMSVDVLASKPSCANTAGASFTAKLLAFAGKAMDVTLVFALWLVDLFIEVGMDRVGQRFRPDAAPSGT